MSSEKWKKYSLTTGGTNEGLLTEFTNKVDQKSQIRL